MQYKFSPQLRFDLGATYVFVDKADIDQNAGSTAQNGLVKGRYDFNVVVVSGQMVYSF